MKDEAKQAVSNPDGSLNIPHAPQSNENDASASRFPRLSWRALIRALQEFHENDLFTSAAAMSYFALLTLFPMLLVLLAASNRFAVTNVLVRRVIAAYPGSSEFLHNTLRSLSDLRTSVVITCLIVMLWAGSWVFAVMERAINRVWATRHRPFFHGRALTLVMFATVGLLLTASVVLTSMLLALRDIAARTPLRILQNYWVFAFVGNIFWQITLVLASILLTIILFTLVYRFIPNCRAPIRACLMSASLAGVLWETAKYIFAWSLHYLNYGEIYGPVGAVVAVLTWSYVSSLILFFGAQLSRNLSETSSSVDGRDR